MIVSIHQPSYWPWLGLLNKIACSDRFIILDNVEANKAAFQYRNLFFCNGKAKHLTLPVDYRKDLLISELPFKNDGWAADHLGKLRNYYLKTPHFRELYTELEELYGGGFERPVDLICETMKYSMDFLGIKTEVLLSSALGGRGSKGEIVLDLVTKASGTVYLSGRGALAYFTEEDMSNFRNRGIEVRWQEFRHPEYPQSRSHPFLEGLACLDLFFFNGREGSREIFWKTVKLTGDKEE